MSTHAIILAAGKGTRMKSEKPKVLHEVRGGVLIDRVLKSLSKVSPCPTIIIGHKGEEIIEHTKNKYHYVWQREQLGTGNAVLCARESLVGGDVPTRSEAGASSYSSEIPPTPLCERGENLKSSQPPLMIGGEIENIIVVYGDHPFISADTIGRLEKSHVEKKAKITMSTITVSCFDNIRPAGVSTQRTPAQKRANQDYFIPTLESPSGDSSGALGVPVSESFRGDSDGALNFDGAYSVFYSYGRVVRGESGNIKSIVEFKDASDEEKNIKELNVGYYCFDADWLWENIGKIDNKNNAGEYNLTDIIKIALAQGIVVNSISIENPTEAVGVNSLEQLGVAEAGLG